MLVDRLFTSNSCWFPKKKKKDIGSVEAYIGRARQQTHSGRSRPLELFLSNVFHARVLCGSGFFREHALAGSSRDVVGSTLLLLRPAATCCRQRRWACTPMESLPRNTRVQTVPNRKTLQKSGGCGPVGGGSTATGQAPLTIDTSTQKKKK